MDWLRKDHPRDLSDSDRSGIVSFAGSRGE